MNEKTKKTIVGTAIGGALVVMGLLKARYEKCQTVSSAAAIIGGGLMAAECLSGNHKEVRDKPSAKVYHLREYT